MRIRLALLATLCACGDAPLSTDFAGTWLGTATIAPTGGTTESNAAQLIIVVSGYTAAIAQVCPDNSSGAVFATGSGNSMTWSGNIVCPPVNGFGCAAAVVAYTSAMATLSNSTLTVVAKGTLSGCGSNDVSTTTTFVGTK